MRKVLLPVLVLSFVCSAPVTASTAVGADGVSIASGYSRGEDHIAFVVRPGPYRVIDTPRGERIEMEEAGYLMEPGKPMLPEERLMILLPPGARFNSLEVEEMTTTELPGTYGILPTPPMVPLGTPHQVPGALRRIEEEWEASRRAAYRRDHAFPAEIARVTGSGTLRQYSYVTVAFRPFAYYPLSGRLVRHDVARFRIGYTLPAVGSADAHRVQELLGDRVAQERASSMFANYEEMKSLYEPADAPLETDRDTYDYVIITTGDLAPAVTASDFLDQKTSGGHNVALVLTSDPEIANQEGEDLAEQIRNFLRANYAAWGMEYVLLVGNYAAVPMRYCYPDPWNHTHDPYNYYSPGGSVPTDYYYADLSLSDDESWDADGDGFYGEYGQDAPDLAAEVYVGRIPTSNTFRVVYALNKLVQFEQDTGSWKTRALHGGAILFYENQDSTGIPFRDGAVCLDLIETDLMPGWEVSRYSEQEGLAPSLYPWPALTEAAFTADWRNGQYGVVNWAGHGSSEAAWRVIWTWDDGDGVFETDGSDGYDNQPFIGDWCDVDGDYPSIVFAVSCNVGYPEPNDRGNLGIDLLTRPSLGSSAGVVSATRVASVSRDWPATPGGAESMCYEFNRYLVDGPAGPERVGEALYDSKCYCHLNYGWDHYREYWNLYDYNLYGDPSLDWLGTATTVEAERGAEPTGSRPALRNQPNPFNPVTHIAYELREAGQVRLEVFNVLGERVAVLVDREEEAGLRKVTWDAGSLPSGIYFCRLRTAEYTDTRSVILAK